MLTFLHSGGEDGADDQSANEIEEDESTLAGMNLQVLGNQLRPFLFFRSTSELMGHLWSGAASEPTPVFRANLLLADYLDIRPLINGFLVEQSLRGIFSVHCPIPCSTSHLSVRYGTVRHGSRRFSTFGRDFRVDRDDTLSHSSYAYDRAPPRES